MLFIHGDKLDGGYVQYSLPEELSGKRMDQCWDSWNLSLWNTDRITRSLWIWADFGNLWKPAYG